MNYCYKITYYDETYKVSTHSKVSAGDIFMDNFPDANLSEAVIRLISADYFHELNCKELV